MKLRPTTYLLLKKLPINGEPPLFFFNHISTKESYKKKKGTIEIIGTIRPEAEFIGGKLLAGKEKAIAICNLANARVGRTPIQSAGYQKTGAKNPPARRDVARLTEKEKE